MSLSKIPFENVKIVGRSKFNFRIKGPLTLPPDAIIVAPGPRYYRGTAIDFTGKIMFATEGPYGEQWGNTNNYFLPGFLFISYDGGTTWARVGPGATAGTKLVWWFDIACNYTGTYVYAFGGGQGQPVWGSADSGLTWTQRPITGIRTNYNRGAGKITCDSTGRIVYTTDAYKIFRSDDYGETWNDISIIFSDSKRSIKDINCDDSGTKLLATATNLPIDGAGMNDCGVHLSTNSGASWSVVTNQPYSHGNHPTGAYPHAYNVYSSLSRDGNTIFVAGTPPFASSNFGSTWTLTNRGGPNPCFVIGNKLYLDSSTGLAVSSNYGVSWTTITSLAGWHYISATPTANPTKMIGIRNSTELCITDDGGANWTRVL